MLIFVILLFFIMIPSVVKAATRLSSSTQNPIVGESFYVQLNIDYGAKELISEAHYKITYDANALEYEKVNWTQSEGEVRVEPGIIYIDKTSATEPWEYGGQVQIKFKTLQSASVQIRVAENGRAMYANGNFISQYFSGVTINSLNPSNNSTLKSLYVEGYEILPTFTRDNHDYNLHVPANVTSVMVNAEQSDSKQRITGLGERVLNYGANRVDVVVYAQDGTTSEYKLMIYREDDRTGDMSLSGVFVNNRNILNGEEDLTKDTFSTVVGRSTETILLTAKTTDPKATLVGTGTKTLNIGENEFKLRVITTNNLEKEYTIIVRRSEEELEPDKQSSKLTRLSLNNIALDLSNDQQVFLYGVGSDVENVNVSTTTESSTAKVEINGDSKLQFGSNVVSVKVTEITGDTTEYKIIVYRYINNVLNISNFSEITNNGNNMAFSRTEADDTIIDKNTLEKLKSNNEDFYYNVINTYNGLLYQLRFNKYDYNDIDTKFTKLSDSKNTYATNIPEGIEMQTYVGDLYNDNTILKVYTYNEKGNYRLLTDGVVVNFGYINYRTNGDKNYVFTTESLIKDENKFEVFFKKYKTLIIGIIFVIIVLSVLPLFKKKKNNIDKKDLTY